MIDSHTHTHYSKHAIGSVNEVVESAIAQGIRYLTLTDHAPFHFDSNNRLLESELLDYFHEIEIARQQYASEIRIFSGLEVDYLPNAEAQISALKSRVPVDFFLGGLHYLPIHGDITKVWELEKINTPEFISAYFQSLERMLNLGVFNAIAHPDSVLRGIDHLALADQWQRILPLFEKHQVAWEINTSGYRKTRYNPTTNTEYLGDPAYPTSALLNWLTAFDIPFTIGSDAHDPKDVGRDISTAIALLKRHGVNTLTYFDQQIAQQIQI